MSAPPLTPVAVEEKLRALVNEVYSAQKELARVRNVECDAELAYKRARLVAGGSARKVVRGQVTVSDREEDIDRATVGELAAFRRATVAREIAQDYLRALSIASENVRSLGASVRQSYSLAGSA